MKLQEVLATMKRIFVKRKYKDILFRYVFRDKKTYHYVDFCILQDCMRVILKRIS